MIRTRNLSLTSTAVEATIQDVVDRINSISIQNTSLSGNVYIGNASVTTTNYGYRLFPSQTITMDVVPYEKIYVVGDTGTTAAILIMDTP
jgi:hypothetical protein